MNMLKAVVNSYKSQKGNPELVYILSARDFNQGYKRLEVSSAINKIQEKRSGNYFRTEGTD